MAVLLTGSNIISNTINFVDYIQANSAQYIDTGIKVDNNTRVVAKVLWTEEGWAFGCDTSWKSNGFGVHSHITYYGTTTKDYTYNGNTILDIDANKNVFSVGNLITKTFTQETFSSGLNLYLFCCNRNGTRDDFMSGRMYSCAIYDNGVLVRDLWPCYDPDGVACMYDKVSGEYFYNAGSGEFTAGVIT